MSAQSKQAVALYCCLFCLQHVNTATYVSHLPVHMDGSCNGLQHYAALGRDEAGGKAVNLLPSDKPQDVYKVGVDLAAEGGGPQHGSGGTVRTLHTQTTMFCSC